MQILDRYIAKTIMLATLLIVAIFIGLLFFLALLTELKNMGEGDYHLLQALNYVLLKLPHQLYQFSPLCMLLGSMLGLGSLSSHKELIMMRSAGFSIQQLIFAVLYTAILLTLVNEVIGEVIAPPLSYYAEIKKENAKNAGQAVITRNGVWFHVDDNFIHVNTVIDRHHLEKVTRYQFDKNQALKVAYFSEKLTLQHHTWSIAKMVKTTFLPDRTKSEIITNTTWELFFNPTLFSTGLLDPEEMSLPRLYHFIHYLHFNQLQSTEYEYEFWQRVFRPFVALLMIFFALPFMLNTLETMSIGKRVLAGLLIGFIFFIFNAFLGQLSIVFQLPAMYAALCPLLLLMIIGMILIKILKRRS